MGVDDLKPFPDILTKEPDGTWREAMPFPFIGIRITCADCGKKFWFWQQDKWREHWKKLHRDTRIFIRTPRGVEVKK